MKDNPLFFNQANQLSKKFSYTGRKGIPKTEQQKQHLSDVLKGKKKNWTKQGLQNLSEDQRSKKITGPAYTCLQQRLQDLAKKKATCPYSGKTGVYTNMCRWHFENCPTIKTPNSKSVTKLIERVKKNTLLIVECPYCGKGGSKPALHRWRFENCKYKP